MSSNPVPPSQPLRVGMIIMFVLLLLLLCGWVAQSQGVFDEVVSWVVCDVANGETNDELDEACANLLPPPSPEPESLPAPISISSTITSACLDNNQLMLSVKFDAPFTGEVRIQVFFQDGGWYEYGTATTIASPTDHLDIILPGVAIPVGGRISGNLSAHGLGIVSYVEYRLNVLDCFPSAAVVLPPTPTSTPNPDGIPVIINSFCVGGKTKQLMVVFQFEQDVTGEYEAFVADMPYQLAPVADQPKRLFFFGTPSPGGGKPKIVLQSLPDHALVFAENAYPVAQCDFSSPNNNSGGGDDYVVPSPGPGE